MLPEWGYGFWKSRDVHEHQDDVLDDFDGFRRHRIPLDAIVIDSPWATQYNTWEFNPYQFPDAPWMVEHMRAAGVRTVVWVTPWINLDSRDGQIPPQPESEQLHREPAPNYAPAAAAGHFVRGRDGEPLVKQWWMGTGSPIDFTTPAAEEWWREQGKRVLELGVEGIKMDDGDGYYIPDDAQLADGRTGARGRVGPRRAAPAVVAARARRGPPRHRRAVRAQRLDRAARDRPHVGRRPGIGLLVAAGARGRDAVRRRAAATRTGRTTSAATSATGWSSGARRSCSCAGSSSDASRR